MKLDADQKKLIKVLFFIFVLSVIVVALQGFKVVMGILLIASFVSFLMFTYAAECNLGVDNVVLKYLVEKSEKNGLTAKQTYMRGMVVSGSMILIIPALRLWVFS